MKKYTISHRRPNIINVTKITVTVTTIFVCREFLSAMNKVLPTGGESSVRSHELWAIVDLMTPFRDNVRSSG
jgi:hypothetical protein